jgi:puromycin-sensitive aminopeptidase
VYTPVGKKEQGEFALECGVRALSTLTHFFNLPYPLKKYDMIAIPDFSAGAMENWGLVTYRSTKYIRIFILFTTVYRLS